MEYGHGYCLPIGYRKAASEQIVPRHGREASLKLLNLDTSQYLHPGVFRDHLAAGKPVLKRRKGDAHHGMCRKTVFRLIPDLRGLTAPVWNILKLSLFALPRD
jgi:hypothetical protein